MVRYYPILLALRGRLCVVVGGGEVAGRKIVPLLDCEARVRAIAPHFGQTVAKLGAAGQVDLVARPFQHGDLLEATVAIAATDDPAINEAIWREAEERGVLVNVVDDPEHCTFAVPASVRRGPLLLTASTDGASPALASVVRERMERDYGPEWGTLATWLGEMRGRIKTTFTTPADRERVWRTLVRSDVLDRLRAGDAASARARVEEIVRQLAEEAG